MDCSLKYSEQSGHIMFMNKERDTCPKQIRTSWDLNPGHAEILIASQVQEEHFVDNVYYVGQAVHLTTSVTSFYNDIMVYHFRIILSDTMLTYF